MFQKLAGRTKNVLGLERRSDLKQDLIRFPAS
jgi:hypothetical protein